MAYSVGTAWLDVVPNMSGIQRTIENELRGVNTDRIGRQAGDDYSSGFGGAAKKITGVLTAAFAGVKIGSFVKDAVDQASDLGEVSTKISQVFSDGAADVQAFAAQGAKALGQTNLQAQNAAATFGVFGKAAGLAGKENAAFSTEMVQLATDLASFNNTSPEQAIEALGAGLRGESEPLRAYGVLLDDASLRQEALAQGLITTTKDALTPQQKVLASHALIMKQTADAQGDFERTSGGLANQQRILAAQFEDMKGKIGAAFLPAVTATVTALNERLFPAVEAVGQKVSGFWNVIQTGEGFDAIGGADSFAGKAALMFYGLNEQITNKVIPDLRANMTEIWHMLTTGDFAGGGTFEEDSPIVSFVLGLRDVGKEVLASVGPIFTEIFNTIGPVFKQVGATLGPAFVEVFNTLKPAIEKLLPIVTQLLPVFNPVGLLFKALLPVLPKIADLVANLATTLAGGLAKALEAVAPLFQTLVGVINRLMPFVTDLVASLLPPLMSLFDRLAPLLDAVLGALIPLVDQIAQALIPIIEALMPVVERVFTFIADTIGNLVTVFSGVIDVITGVLSGDWSKVWDGIKTIFSGIWDQIVNVLSTAWDVIVELFTNLGPKVLEIIDGFLDWMVEKGQEFLGWLWEGIQDAAGAVWEWFAALPGEAWNRVAAFGSWMLDRGKELIGWIVQGIKDGASALWDWITGSPTDPNTLLGGIWASFTSIGGKLLEFGGKVVGWIVQGIKDGINAVADAITGLFSDLTFEPDGTISTPQGYVTANPFAGGSARGGVIPGADPGRRDNVLGRLPNGVGWGLRSGESVFVPEFTQAIGGASTVAAWNRAAEQGTLSQYFGPGFARGGVVGYGTTMAELTGKKVVDTQDDWGKHLLDAMIGKAKGFLSTLWSGLFGATVSGGLNLSQDPSSFGWNRAQGIVPYSWNGNPVLGGVAGGTEGLWGALLSALVPQIPGGLLSPMYGFENRDNVNSPGTPSFHSYGLAVDINAPFNGNGAPGYGRSGRGVIPAELAHSLAAKFGMIWGGDFTGTPDPMHFEIHVSPNQISGGGIVNQVASGIWSQVTGTGVDRWRPTVLQALGITGQPASYADIVLNQMRTESSGNARAINLTDSNAQRGIPSKGLMQVIDPTFRSYALAPYNQDIYDPLSNIIASIRYVLARYGSIPAGMQGHAYDTGGIWEPGTFGVNLLNRPEAVLTPSEKDAYQAHAAALAAGYGGQVVEVRLRGEGPLTDALAAASQVTVSKSFRALNSELRVRMGVS